ncbi:FIST C-terminal domain-containing protein, partial [Escherichia coli]|nr:FIST C-terminal domain-containing protein [Escherichia coli]
TSLTFCRRDPQAARRDLVRICAEIREALEPQELWNAPPAAPAGTGPLPSEVGGGGRIIRGAVYVSCPGRGGAHFGAPHAELQLVRHALGEVP